MDRLRVRHDSPTLRSIFELGCPTTQAHRPVSYGSRRLALANRWDRRHLRTVLEHLHPQAGSTVLEVGCGRGHLVNRLTARGLTVVGVDVNPQAIALSVAEGTRVMDATALEFADASFDAVCSFHAIEHIPDVDLALREMVRVTKPGGLILLVYPAEPIRGLYAIPASFLAFGTPRLARRIHVHKLWPRRLRAVCEPLGLSHIHSEFHLLTSPQFVSVFRKP